MNFLLVPMLGQITGRNNDGDIKSKLGKLDLHQDTNYVDMDIYMQILAVALSNVSAYVTMERKARKPERSSSNPKNSPDKTPPEILLEMINEIRALHSSICKSNIFSRPLDSFVIVCRPMLILNDIAQKRHCMG